MTRVSNVPRIAATRKADAPMRIDVLFDPIHRCQVAICVGLALLQSQMDHA
jgi:hypothetical protein